MTETNARPEAPARSPAAGSRIVLFGMPAAGKSSLLGALAQAAQIQEHLLHGHVTDLTHGLDELQHRVYADKPQRTAEEIVPYPIRFEPFTTPATNGAAGDKLDAVLIDCDGRVANDLLVRRETLREDSPEGTLAREVLDADTLLLVVDAAAPPAHVEEDFVEFGRFLRLFERGRGQRAEVSGLPVFLVLTKCDLLAEPQDKPADWMDRIEERKRQVDQRFKEFLAKQSADVAPAFGSIDLRLWATAVHRPALAGVPARPNEPFGVAELFRQALAAASDFRGRSRQASKRLLWTVGGAGGILTVMAALAIALIGGHKDKEPSELQNKVENYRFSEGQTVADRLRGSPAHLKQNRDTLKEWIDDPGFPALPAKEQQYLQERYKELNDYLAYYEQLQALRPLSVVRTEAELQSQQDILRTSLQVSRSEWSQTDAARLHDSCLAQIKALLDQADRLESWYAARAQKGRALWLFTGSQPGGEALNWSSWQDRVKDLLESARTPPARANDPVPGADTVTFATLFALESVASARTTWESIERDLLRLRDLAAALGLGGAVADRPAVLAIPTAPSFSLGDAGRRLETLRKNYPRYEEEFTLAGLPDAVKKSLQQEATANYRRLLEPARQEVLRRLVQAAPGEEETPARWHAVLDWLAEPVELHSWRVLARVLLRLADPDRPELDPVTALAAFLKQEKFELDPRRLSLEIPDTLGKKPAGTLTIFLRGGGKVSSLVFEALPDKQRDAQRQVTTYELRVKDKETLVYRPGDQLWAELPLRDLSRPEEEWQLLWATSRSLVYQFERLRRPPRLLRKGQETTEGKIEEGVVLTVTQGSAGPVVPDLVPVVRLGSR